MRGPNLSAWAVSHGAVMRFVLVLAVIAGAYAYWSLGRQEDPDFTLKNMLVSAAWPGASAEEMAHQVGFVVLLMLMLFVIFIDIERLNIKFVNDIVKFFK